jgi:septal ring factor EnvC (AmiA/AmiB activator)
MTKTMRHAVVFFALLFLLGSGWAQRHHDPLNDSEVDQLRETAQEPAKRMKLYVGFAKARMEMIHHLRTDPALMGKDDEEMRSRLEDLASLVDEIDDNLDEYNGKSQDLRKPLKQVVEMDSDFQVKLTELKRTSTEAQLRNYGFALEDAMDSVNESADSARAMLQDQVSKRGKPKENEKEDKEDNKKPKGHDDEVKAPCSPC